VRALCLAVALFRRLDRALERVGFAPVDAESAAEAPPAHEPDATIGPILAPADAPGLFDILRRLARKLGCPVPAEVRLSYIPACGVLEVPVNEVYSRPVLVLGLPCLQIWSRRELKAVLAHELTHLRHEDASFARNVLHLVEAVRARVAAGRGDVSRANPRWLLRRALSASMGPLAALVGRSMEYRADQWSARTYGSEALSRALEKMAVVQPVFREVLAFADRSPSTNVYRIFRRAWNGLSGEKYERLRDRLIEASRAGRGGAHPSVADRLRRLKKLRPGRRGESHPTLYLLDDPNVLERLFHNRLFGLHVSASVFRPASLECGRAACG
jgi:Zn-dependent protease with chaperone function